MEPFYRDNHNTIYCIDFRKNELPDESVQCVVTSPPYWGLRKYAGEQELIWGDNNCEHEWGAEIIATGHKAGETNPGKEYYTKDAGAWSQSRGGFCSLCGTWKGAFGLEPTLEMYVQHTIEILREIKRVLRKDGVVFWNIGDSYWGGQPHRAGETNPGKEYYTKDVGAFGQVDKSVKHSTLKPKDLCLIPFRVAIAAQEDGWWVRSVIIWSKPNPMPESVTDRPTESHEYILMLTKSARYYWDQEAVREPYSETVRWGGDKYKGAVKRGTHGEDAGLDRERSVYPGAGRNIRSVWEFPTQPFPEAHFAVFPEKLPETCIKAATPEVGCCSKCGAPWTRVLSKGFTSHDGESKTAYTNEEGHNANQLAKLRRAARAMGGEYRNIKETLGWQPTCKCNASRVPSIVLDPLMGAGTTLLVAKNLNRFAMGYELSGEYCQLAVERCRQQVLV